MLILKCFGFGEIIVNSGYYGQFLGMEIRIYV